MIYCDKPSCYTELIRRHFSDFFFRILIKKNLITYPDTGKSPLIQSTKYLVK